MIGRRREKRALDAIQDLVRFLRGVREERKAILAVTDGWLLYRPNSALMRPVGDRPPPVAPPISVDPRSGTLTTKNPTSLSTMNAECDRDRMMLAQIDDEREFLQILDEANRANASFYPIDPRGLAVFDTPIDAGVTLTADRAMLRSRGESLRNLASATDGTAIMTNDISGALRRVMDDLSSYYLLGYYSSGRLDGKFHSISVRVKRPGVRVRARRGYLAANTAEAEAAAAARANAVAPPSAEAAAEARAIETALAPLPGYARDMPLRTDAVAGWRRGGDGKPTAAFWVVGEFSAGTPPGRTIDATLVAPSGATAARATSESGARYVLMALTPTEAMEAGEYTVRVRGEGFGFATIRLRLPPSPDAGGALFFRRGQTTGNQTVVTADRRFRRNEQLRMEMPLMPLPGSGTVSARLLDRTGKALAVPVNVSARDDSEDRK